jgi:hypothetical protein
MAIVPVIITIFIMIGPSLVAPKLKRGGRVLLPYIKRLRTAYSSSVGTLED